MRILFYSDNFYPETSGISDSIIATARGLKAQGHTVGFVAARYSDADYAAVGRPRDEYLEREGFAVHRIPSLAMGASGSGQARMAIPFGWSLNFVRKFKPDVIHSQSPFGTGIEALVTSRVFGIPLVGTNHTLIREFIRIYGPIRAQWAENITERFFSWYYNRCRFVSVVSGQVLDGMRVHGFRRKADIILNPVSISMFAPATAGEKAGLRKEFGLVGPTAMYAGRIADEKRLDVVLRAFSELKKTMQYAHLVIAGNGPAEQRTRAYAEALGVGGSVIFTGFLDHESLSKWYKASDVFVMMCPIETQCLALMQAFASGIPAVGVAAGAVKEHVKPAFGATVPEADHRALAAELGKMLSDQTLAREKGLAAREYVKAFSEDAIAGEWIKAYATASRMYLTMPKVSVIIPAYNERDMIAATLRAISVQDYPDYEVIVVDNASTDGTAEVASSFNVKVVREPKKGLLAARERGRLEAQGDIIVQMDADCLPDRDWLARGASHFADPSVMGVAGPYDYHDGGPLFRFVSLISQRYVYRGMSRFLQFFDRGAVLIGGNSFIRASALEKTGGYDTSIVFYGEDTDTAKRVARQGRVLFDPRLAQKTSARRFKAEGTMKISALYLFHFFKVICMSGRKKKAS
ncbi:MAG TPA: glycosyltransferase [Candidatus Paceibacterota bacterium]|nr:glycosyltransferase [Candidatus Paceibacterota bacterium]